MTTLDLNTARAFVLHTQLLEPGAALSGKNGTFEVVKNLGYVQIDTISVVERAHHHVLWTRVPDYVPEHLQTLDEKDRLVFDYWAHAASYLPMEDYRFSLVRKAELDDGSGFWRRTDPELAAHVLDRIREEGPLMSKDFEKEKETLAHPWMIPAINQVIRQLFMKGELMVAGRRGIQKTYDLPERVLPAGTDTRMPSRGEYVEWLVCRSLQAHGLVKLQEFGYLRRIPRTETQAVLKKMLHTGEVTEVRIETVEGGPYFAFSEKLANFEPSECRRFHILSPFDNLIIQRKRLEELFGFRYTLECYVPAAKRKIGYFSLPLLYGTEFAGQADLKTDRKSKVLLVKNLVWEGKPADELRAAFEEKLVAFAKFNGCSSVQMGPF